jgi:peroxiredoxin
MGKKLLFLIATLFILSTLPANSEEGNLYSKIGIQSIGDKKKAPHFYLEGLNGEKVQLKALKGKIIFLNFWATWCGPCKEEMPSMEALWQQFRGKDFVLLSISVDYEGVKPVKEYIEKQRYTFRVVIDPQCEVLDLYEVKAIPTTLIIDKKGQIIAMAIGPKDWKGPEAISLVDLLLKN